MPAVHRAHRVLSIADPVGAVLLESTEGVKALATAITEGKFPNARAWRIIDDHRLRPVVCRRSDLGRIGWQYNASDCGHGVRPHPHIQHAPSTIVDTDHIMLAWDIAIVCSSDDASIVLQDVDPISDEIDEGFNSITDCVATRQQQRM